MRCAGVRAPTSVSLPTGWRGPKGGHKPASQEESPGMFLCRLLHIPSMRSPSRDSLAPPYTAPRLSKWSLCTRALTTKAVLTILTQFLTRRTPALLLQPRFRKTYSRWLSPVADTAELSGVVSLYNATRQLGIVLQKLILSHRGGCEHCAGAPKRVEHRAIWVAEPQKVWCSGLRPSGLCQAAAGSGGPSSF